MLCDRGGPVSSRIWAEFFILFPFTLKSVQFMSRAFLLIVVAFLDVTEERKLNFSFTEAEFWIVISFSILLAWILSGVFSLLDDLLISDLTLEYEFMFSFAIADLTLEYEFMFSFAIAEFVTYEFSFVLTIKYESIPCAVGLLNIIFFVNKLHWNSLYEVSVSICDHSF